MSCKHDNDNNIAKVEDSAYGNSQSQGLGSSLSRNSNSSGYCGHPSTSDSRNEVVPKQLKVKKTKEHMKKKKLKTSSTKNDNILDVTPKIITDENRQYLVNNITNQTFNKSEVGPNKLVGLKDSTGKHNESSTSPERAFGYCQNTKNSSYNNELDTIVLLNNGLIVHSPTSLQNTLGYPDDKWINHSFIDFIHPNDKSTFTNKLDNSINFQLKHQDQGIIKHQLSLFCSLKKYPDNNLFNELNNDNKEIQSEYFLFHLKCEFKHFWELTIEAKIRITFLIITAEHVVPVYQLLNKIDELEDIKFTTQHKPDCNFSYVDDNVVPYLGYLPQDMIGHSLFDFYHPDDLYYIKEIYKTVMKMEEKSFKSNAYRFFVKNGDWVVLETEWSSYINPWTNKLELIICYHKIIRGPTNPNVFDTTVDQKELNIYRNMNDDAVKKSLIIQNEILDLLDKKTKKSDNINYDELINNKTSKTLSTFMESLIMKGTTAIAKKSNDSVSILQYERDSILLGKISPHHDIYDSKSSSETSPSYNQLNYYDKLDRFFNSKILCNNENDYIQVDDNGNSSNDDISKTSPNLSNSNHLARENSGSGENLSSNSNNQTNSPSRKSSADNIMVKYSNNINSITTTIATTSSVKTATTTSVTLSESALNNHNQNMEKLLLQKHKESELNIKNNKNSSILFNTSHIYNEFYVKRKKLNKNRRKKRSNDEHFNQQVIKKMKYDNDNNSLINLNNNQLWPSTIQEIPSYSTYYLPLQQRINNNSCLYTNTQFTGILHPTTKINSLLPYPSTNILNPSLFINYNNNSIKSNCDDISNCNDNKFKNHSSNISSNNNNSDELNQLEKVDQDILLKNYTIINKEKPLDELVEIKNISTSENNLSSNESDDENYSNCVEWQSINNNSRQNNLMDSSENSSDSSFYGNYLEESGDSSGIVSSQIHNQKNKINDDTNIINCYDKQMNESKINFTYQLNLNETEILKSNLEALKHFKQPSLVNDQLNQLYDELKGLEIEFDIGEDGDYNDDDKSSNGSDTCDKNSPHQVRKTRDDILKKGNQSQ